MTKQGGAAALALALLSGCGTILTLSESETKNKVYSGTIRHLELKCAHAVCLDFPLSLVADTVVLPVTIPWSLINLVKSSSNKPTADNNPPNSTLERDAPQAARPSP